MRRLLKATFCVAGMAQGLLIVRPISQLVGYEVLRKTHPELLVPGKAREAVEATLAQDGY